MPDPEIRVADTDAEIEACFPVMAQLRPHLERGSFVRRVREQEGEGYRLASIWDDGKVRAVAGFRVLHNLAWGRFLYIDDLVTDQGGRSRGLGGALLNWCLHRAVAEKCTALHLDSGIQRRDAHRFYLARRMRIMGYHFSMDVDQ